MSRLRPKAFKPYVPPQPKEAVRTTVIHSDVKTDAKAVDLELDQQLVSDLSDLGIKNSLPFISEVYNISDKLEDYVLVPTIVCPSDTPNRNGIAFPIDELVRFRPYPIFRQAYKTWAGTPIHIEHDNKDHSKAIGVMFDTMLTKLEGFNGGKFWKVMGLIGVDKSKNELSAKYAQALLDNELNTFSMGADASELRCSICNSLATADVYKNCPHIASIDKINFKKYNYNGKDRLAYLNAYHLSPFECSIVHSPAWISAASDTVL